MAEPWYQNPLPGFSILNSEEVIVLPRKQGLDTRQATRNYTDSVLDEVDHLRGEGWHDWIAPEGHQADKGAGDAWHWDTENPGRFLEALYFPTDVSPMEIIDQYEMHGGQAWQYPILFFFPSTPNSGNVMEYLRTKRCPVAFLNDMVVDESDQEEEEPDIITPPTDLELRHEVQAVLEFTEGLRQDWKTTKNRRKKVRTGIIKPLRRSLTR